MGFFTNSSPYASTQIVDDQYPDTLTIRPIPAQPDDVLYKVEPNTIIDRTCWLMIFTATKNYGGCLPQRNMDKISDPVYDLIPGLEIFIPRTRSRDTLGV